MYAVFQTGGKQFSAKPGARLRIPAVKAEEGSTISFDQVLLASDGDDISVGRPRLSGAKVTAEVLRHGKDKKIIVFKRKRRKGHRKKQGHRQKFTEIRIADIKI